MLPCGEVTCCSVCIIECCSYYQTQCCHVGRLLVVVSVSLSVVTITRHSVAMWGGYLPCCCVCNCIQLLPDTVLPTGCQLLCLYHCINLLPDTVLPLWSGIVVSYCILLPDTVLPCGRLPVVCVIVTTYNDNYYQDTVTLPCGEGCCVCILYIAVTRHTVMPCGEVALLLCL